MSEHSSDESFLHDHSKELVIGSAIGAIGVIWALTARRLRAQDQAAEADASQDSAPEAPSENS